MNTLDKVLDGLMTRYTERVPYVSQIVSELIKRNVIHSINDIENDHIAFRTMGVPYLGIQSLEKIFLHLGYIKKDHYYFENKHLDAFWYQAPKDHYPRIFISELRVKDLSINTQKIIHKYTDTLTSDPVDNLNLNDAKIIDTFLHSALWQEPTWEDYSTVLEESEYGSWVLYNKYYLNHFTITIQNLQDGYNTIPLFNNFIKSINIPINTAGGPIKTSKDGLLIQSATVANTIEAEFLSKKGKSIHTISGSYVEFAERKVLEKFKTLEKNKVKRSHRRDGFDAGNADNIFESTYKSQTKND